jgi:hypothetical protein
MRGVWSLLLQVSEASRKRGVYDIFSFQRVACACASLFVELSAVATEVCEMMYVG